MCFTALFYVKLYYTLLYHSVLCDMHCATQNMLTLTGLLHTLLQLTGISSEDGWESDVGVVTFGLFVKLGEH